MPQQRQSTSSMEDLEPFLPHSEKLPHPSEFEDEAFVVRAQRNWRQYIIHIIAITIEVALAVFILFGSSRSGSHLLENELDVPRDVIQYETQTFVASGFHEHDDHPPTVFEHLTGAETDRAWLNLTSVGVVGLDEEQNAKLATPSVESIRDPGTYPVAIGMFHQLHCLNYLRLSLEMGPNDNPSEDHAARIKHRTHCLDYLRQTVQCHGDLTPIAFWYDESSEVGYGFDHAITHTCRNFDSIYGWAVENAAEVHIEG